MFDDPAPWERFDACRSIRWPDDVEAPLPQLGKCLAQLLPSITRITDTCRSQGPPLCVLANNSGAPSRSSTSKVDRPSEPVRG